MIVPTLLSWFIIMASAAPVSRFECALCQGAAVTAMIGFFFSDGSKRSSFSHHSRGGHSRPKSEPRLSHASASILSGAAATVGAVPAAGPSWWNPSSLRTIPLVSCRGRPDVHPPAATGGTPSKKTSRHAQTRRPFYHHTLT